jgi:hypothetical protein
VNCDRNVSRVFAQFITEENDALGGYTVIDVGQVDRDPSSYLLLLSVESRDRDSKEAHSEGGRNLHEESDNRS